MHEAAREALEIAQAIGDPYGSDAALEYLGSVAAERGDPEQAIEFLDRALRLAGEIGDRSVEASAWIRMGQVRYYLGELAQAQRALERALEISSSTGEQRYAVAAYPLLALVLLALGHVEEAITRAQAGLREAERLGIPYLVGVALRVTGEVAGRAGVERAGVEPAQCFEESMRILRGIGAQAELAHSLAAYGRYQHSCGDERRSAGLLGEARALYTCCGMVAALARLDEATSSWLSPGQARVRLPAASAPTGRPLQDDEWVEVLWTVEAPEDEQVTGKAARRQGRVLRMLGEAAGQGAAPTVDALAAALDVSQRTIERDLAALRQAGHEVVTRGSRQIS